MNYSFKIQFSCKKLCLHLYTPYAALSYPYDLSHFTNHTSIFIHATIL